MSGVTDGGTVTGTRKSSTAPLKIQVVSAIFVIWGLLCIVGGLVMVAFTDALSQIPVVDLTGFGVTFALIFFLIAAVDFALAYGIWHVTQWGWLGGLILSILFTLLWLVSLIQEVDILSLIFLVSTAYCIYALYVDRKVFEIGS